MPADLLVALPLEQQVLPVGDGTPPPPLIEWLPPHDRVAERQKREDLRLNKPLPKRPHHLAPNDGQAVSTVAVKASHRARHQTLSVQCVRVGEQEELAARFLHPLPAQAHCFPNQPGGRGVPSTMILRVARPTSTVRATAPVPSSLRSSTTTISKLG